MHQRLTLLEALLCLVDGIVQALDGCVLLLNIYMYICICIYIYVCIIMIYIDLHNFSYIYTYVMKIAFIIAHTKNNVVVLFGSLKVQSSCSPK